MENGEYFSRLAGFLSLLQFNDEPQARSGSERERLLGDAELLARLPYEFPDIGCLVLQWNSQKLPNGNIIAVLGQKGHKTFPSGNILFLMVAATLNIPAREYLAGQPARISSCVRP